MVPPAQRCPRAHHLVAAGTVTIVLVTVGFALHQIQESTATANLDEVLSDEAEVIAVAMGKGEEIPPLYDDDRVMLARGPTGDILAFTGAVADLFDLELRTQDDRGITIELDGEQHRVVAERYATRTGVGVVMIGERLDEMSTNLDHLTRTLRWVIPLTVASPCDDHETGRRNTPPGQSCRAQRPTATAIPPHEARGSRGVTSSSARR